MGLVDTFGAEDRVQVKLSDFYKLMKQATQYEIAMNAVGCDVPHRYIRECMTGVKEPQKQGIQIELENPANKSMMSAKKGQVNGQDIKGSIYLDSPSLGLDGIRAVTVRRNPAEDASIYYQEETHVEDCKIRMPGR